MSERGIDEKSCSGGAREERELRPEGRASRGDSAVKEVSDGCCSWLSVDRSLSSTWSDGSVEQLGEPAALTVPCFWEIVSMSREGCGRREDDEDADADFFFRDRLRSKKPKLSFALCDECKLKIFLLDLRSGCCCSSCASVVDVCHPCWGDSGSSL